MRTLSLLRHAKSSWDDERLADVERPLAPRGSKAAPRMGRHMREIGVVPDLVLCSPARRTRETADLVLPCLAGPPPRLLHDPAIYEATVEELMAVLRRVGPEVAHALLIGHNPGLQELAIVLTEGTDSEDRRAIAEKLPTTALVVIDLAITDWGEISGGKGRIRHLATPRMLAD
ncbi:MAG: histidine phosphatase family protein [Hyphomicrobiaceae bacterium]